MRACVLHFFFFCAERFLQTQPGNEEEETVPIFVPGAVFILHPYSRARLCWDVYMIM